MLTDKHKACIKATPFGWLLMINTDMKINRRIVRELSSRWVEKISSFEIRSQVVSFTLIDVCIRLGLRV